MKVRGLGCFIIGNFRPLFHSQCNGLLIGQGSGAGAAGDKRQGPVIAVIWNAQEQLFPGNCGYRIVQDGPDAGQRCHRHGGTLCVSPFVGHQQSAVYRRADGCIVVAFVEDSRLGGRGLRCQCGPKKQTPGAEQSMQALQKGRVWLGERCGQIFKIHIQSPVSLCAQDLKDLQNQFVLHGAVCQDQCRALSAEFSLLRQRGQTHHRLDSILPGGGKQSGIFRSVQASVSSQSIGKGSQGT